MICRKDGSGYEGSCACGGSGVTNVGNGGKAVTPGIGGRMSHPKPKPKMNPGESVHACCEALVQDSNIAPEPTKTVMLGAATACRWMEASGSPFTSVTASLTASLGGVGLPNQCR
jgi:hypothetical protein